MPGILECKSKYFRVYDPGSGRVLANPEHSEIVNVEFHASETELEIHVFGHIEKELDYEMQYPRFDLYLDFHELMPLVPALWHCLGDVEHHLDADPWRFNANRNPRNKQGNSKTEKISEIHDVYLQAAFEEQALVFDTASLILERAYPQEGFENMAMDPDAVIIHFGVIMANDVQRVDYEGAANVVLCIPLNKIENGYIRPMMEKVYPTSH